MLSSGYTPEDIIYNIAEDVEIVDTVDVEFRCNCSKERFARGIMSLGSDELLDMINDNKEIETTCHFCGEKYYFSKEELIEILSHTKKVN